MTVIKFLMPGPSESSSLRGSKLPGFPGNIFDIYVDIGVYPFSWGHHIIISYHIYGPDYDYHDNNDSIHLVWDRAHAHFSAFWSLYSAPLSVAAKSVVFFVFHDHTTNTHIVKIPGTPCPDLEGQTQQGSRALVQEKPCKYQSYFVIMSKTSAHLVEQSESEC